MEKNKFWYFLYVCVNFYRRFRAVAVKLREELKRKGKKVQIGKSGSAIEDFR